MKSVFKPVLLAGLLATAGFTALSQAPAAGEHGYMVGAGGPMHEGMGHSRMGKMDPAKMQAWMDKRNAELKAKLKLTPAQEGAWTTYATLTSEQKKVFDDSAMRHQGPEGRKGGLRDGKGPAQPKS